MTPDEIIATDGLVTASTRHALTNRLRSVQLRMDRGRSAMVIRSGSFDLVVLTCGTTYLDARTGLVPQRPPAERAEATTTLIPEQVAELIGMLRDGDRVSLNWTVNPPHLAHLRPTERCAVTVLVAHADGTFDQVFVPTAQVRTARPGQRTIV